MIALTGWFFVLSSNSVRDRIRLDDLVGDHVVGDVMEHATGDGLAEPDGRHVRRASCSTASRR